MTRIEVARLRLPIDVDKVVSVTRHLTDDCADARVRTEHDDRGVAWLVITREETP